MIKLYSNANLKKQNKHTHKKQKQIGVDATLDKIIAEVLRQEKKHLLNADSLCKMVVII